MLLLVGQVGARHERARGLPGARLPPGLRARREVGDAGRRRRAAARGPRPRVLGGVLRAAGAGRRRAARGHADASARRARRRPRARGVGRAGAAELERLRELLGAAERPLAIVGEGGWTAQAGADVVAFARAAGVPVAASFRCQDYVDNDAEVYAGARGDRDGPAAGAAHRRGRRAARDRRPPRGHPVERRRTLLDIPRPRQRLVHVHPDPDELGAVYQPELAIVSGLPAFAAAARALAPPAGAERRRGLVAQARAEYEANLARAPRAPGRAAARRGHGGAARAPRRRRDPHLRRRQLHRVGAPLLRVPALPDPARAAQRRDGLRRSRRRSRPRPSRPSAPSSAWPATATS